MLQFRDGTWDEMIWMCVARDNEYLLPSRFQADDVIIDIGAHIGSFTYAVLDRGAGLVIAVEANRDNFRQLQHNIHHSCGATDRAVLIAAARVKIAIANDREWRGGDGDGGGQDQNN